MRYHLANQFISSDGVELWDALDTKTGQAVGIGEFAEIQEMVTRLNHEWMASE